MRLGTRFVGGAVATAGVLLVSACYGMRAEPATPLPARLVAPAGFVVHQPAQGVARRTPTCFIHRADVYVDEIRGDTLMLRSVRVHWVKGDQRGCVDGGPAFVVRSGESPVLAESYRLARGRSIVAFLILAPAAALVIWLISFE